MFGYRNSNTFLKAEFERYGEVYTVSDDGSVGIKGTVIEVLNENKLAASTVMACGLLPMLRAVKAYCALNNLECYVSLEERMACSIGACLACVCKTVTWPGWTPSPRSCCPEKPLADPPACGKAARSSTNRRRTALFRYSINSAIS